MGYYDVLLGIDHAARDTGRRLRMRVRGRNALEAGIAAERIADSRLDDPLSEYSHAMRVTPVMGQLPAAVALPIAA